MIVAIDGPGGAGKTTLAISIAALLGPSIVVPTDDFRCPPADRIRRFLADGDPGWNTTLSASATRFWSQRVVALRPAGSALPGRATCAVQEGPRVRRIWLFLFQEILPTRVKSHLTRFLLDGLKCLDMLRASKGTEQTPVILMSAAPPQGVQSRTDLVLLEKPFEMDILLALIRRLLFES